MILSLAGASAASKFAHIPTSYICSYTPVPFGHAIDAMLGTNLEARQHHHKGQGNGQGFPKPTGGMGGFPGFPKPTGMPGGGFPGGFPMPTGGAPGGGAPGGFPGFPGGSPGGGAPAPTGGFPGSFPGGSPNGSPDSIPNVPGAGAPQPTGGFPGGSQPGGGFPGFPGGNQPGGGRPSRPSKSIAMDYQLAPTAAPEVNYGYDKRQGGLPGFSLLDPNAPAAPSDAPTLPSGAPSLPSGAPELPSGAPELPSGAPELPFPMPSNSHLVARHFPAHPCPQVELQEVASLVVSPEPPCPQVELQEAALQEVSPDSQEARLAVLLASQAALLVAVLLRQLVASQAVSQVLPCLLLSL
jgi:hypothetical protein